MHIGKITVLSITCPSLSEAHLHHITCVDILVLQKPCFNNLTREETQREDQSVILKEIQDKTRQSRLWLVPNIHYSVCSPAFCNSRAVFHFNWPISQNSSWDIKFREVHQAPFQVTVTQLWPHERRTHHLLCLKPGSWKNQEGVYNTNELEDQGSISCGAMVFWHNCGRTNLASLCLGSPKILMVSQFHRVWGICAGCPDNLMCHNTDTNQKQMASPARQCNIFYSQTPF